MHSLISRPRAASLLCGLLFLCSNGGNKPVTPVLASTLRALEAQDRTSPTPGIDGLGDHQCWIFSHLNKSGGSTTRHIIWKRWGKIRSSIYDSPQWKEGTAFTAHYAELLLGGKWNVITGGYTEALRPYVGDRCKWFTLFRHPVPRLVSAYFYCKKVRPSDQLCASGKVKAQDVDLVTFAKHWGNYALRQFALSLVDAGGVMKYAMATKSAQRNHAALKDPGWYILKKYLDREGHALEGSDRGGEPLPGRAMYDMLMPTRVLLRQNMTAVGILEHFGETLELFNRALGMPGLDWQKSFDKVGARTVDLISQTEKDEALTEAWTNAEIKEYIGLDLLLYEHAVDIFKEQKELYGI